MRDLRFPAASRLAGFGTTIFTEMSALAERTGSINLGQGFPDEDGPSAVLEAAVQAVRDGHNQYAPLPGVPALLDAIAEHQRVRYGLEHEAIQVTFGATEAITAALLGLCEPGDEVVALDPFYDSYRAGVALRPGAARCRHHPAHARAAAQLAPQPDRPRARPRGARADRRGLRRA